MKFTGRQKKLNDLCEVIQERLTVWAEENDVLADDEELFFVLDVRKKKTRGLAVKSLKDPRLGIHSQTKPLTDEDWQKIFAVNWDADQRSALKKFKRRGNKPVEAFKNSIYPQSFNARFLKEGLPYRFAMPSELRGKGGSYRVHLRVMPQP